MHEVSAQQEIRHAHMNGKLFLSQINLLNKIINHTPLFTVTEYFKNDKWKVHPDFVYCEYNSLHDLEKERDNSGEQFPRDRDDNFRTPEDQILHFLARAGRPGWKWMSVSIRT